MKNTIAFGNQENDRKMVFHAGRGFVMYNGGKKLQLNVQCVGIGITKCICAEGGVGHELQSFSHTCNSIERMTGMFDFCIGSFRVNLWDADVRRRLREMGVQQLSVSCEDFMLPQYGSEDALRLCELFLENGLRAVTSHPPFGSFNEPFSLLRQDPEERAQDIEWMRKFLVRCGLLKIQAIPLHTGGAMLSDSREWEIACAESYVRALLPTSERANVIIAVENTNHVTPIGFYQCIPEPARLNNNIWKFDDADRILRFVHGFNSLYVRICYDTGHSNLLGKMMEDMQRFLLDIALFHLHDNDGAGNDAYIQTGYGNAPWQDSCACQGGRSMLTFLLNCWNTIGELPEREISKCGLTTIGVCAELPPALRQRLAKAAPMLLCDACLSIAEMSWADALEVVVRDAADLSEKFLLFSAGTSCDLGRDEGILAEQARRVQRKCAQSGMTMLLTNRRSQPSQTCVWAEKLARLCDRCGAGLALDLGASHSYDRALEDFWNLHERADILLCNDNYGQDAYHPVGHPDYAPWIWPDNMR